MIRNLLLAGIFASIAVTGCDRKTETNDPDQTQEPTPQSEVEVIEESTTTEADSSSGTGTSTDATDQNNTDALSATGDDASGDSATGQAQEICTPEWFEWVNAQVMSTQGEAVTEQYPTGLPDVGSTEWFMAVDKLTGGDGAHGPDGGSDEWCAMMQQRLGSND